jgi:TonB family protein
VRTVRLSPGELRKRAVQCAIPLYPALGTRVDVKGMVVVMITVDTDGSVRSARAVSGHLLLRASAVQAAMKWKFKPATFNGRPARAAGLLLITFSRDADEMNRQAVRRAAGCEVSPA